MGGGVDFQGLVAGRKTVGVIEKPISTDGAAAFETVEGHTGEVERLCRGNAGSASTDHARAGESLVCEDGFRHRVSEVLRFHQIGHEGSIAVKVSALGNHWSLDHRKAQTHVDRS